MKLRRWMWVSALVPLVWSLGSGQGYAQENEGARVYVGAGVLVETIPFLGESGDLDVSPVPIILYQGERISAGVDGLGVKVFERDGFEVDVRARPRFGFADPGEVTGLEDMNRDMAGEVGLAAQFERGPVVAEFDYFIDVTDAHGGQDASLRVGMDHQISDRMSLGWRVGGRWQDQDLSTYLYGVYAEEARQGRPAYAVDAGVTPVLEAEFTYAINTNWLLVAGADVEFLSDSAKDSPIIDADHVAGGHLVLLRRF